MMTPSPPDLPSGHDLTSLRLLLEAHGWDTRSSARALGIPYRRLTALRQAYGLRAPSRHTSKSPADPVESPTLESPPGPPRAMPNFGSELISVPQWGQLTGRKPHTQRDLRQSGRLSPLYVYGHPPIISYYTTAQATVLPPGQGQPAQPLEGYTALHQLEREHGPLQDLARRLCEAGELRLIGQRPTLLSDADAFRLLLEQSQEPPSVQATIHPTRTDLPVRSTPRAASLPPDPFPTPPITWPALAPTPSRPFSSEPVSSEAVSTEPATAPIGLPYVSQAAWLKLPRFEALWQGEEVVILDRGAGGEHWFDPQPQARFLNPALAQTIFPVLHTRPSRAVPLDSPSPFLESPKLEDPELDRATPDSLPEHVLSAVQDDALPSVRPGTVDTSTQDSSRQNSSSQHTSTQVEGFLEHDLRIELEQTRTQLEQAQENLVQAQRELDAQRAVPLPQEKAQTQITGQRRMPDHRVRQLEEALREREHLGARVGQLEAQLQGALADVGALERPRARSRQLAHVRDRLRERFDLDYSPEQVEALDRQVAGLPSIGVAKNGAVFKLVRVGEHTLYAVITRDDRGEDCIGTVYTLDMYNRAQMRLPKGRSR